MDTNAKCSEQQAREGAAANNAIAQFWDNLKKKPEHSPLTKSLLPEYWEALTEGIRKKQEEYLSPKRKFESYRVYFVVIEPESLAVITLRCILQNFGRRPDGTGTEDMADHAEDAGGADDGGESPVETKFAALAREIGRRCFEHWRFMSRSAKKRGLARTLTKFRSASAKKRAEQQHTIQLGADWGQENEDLKLGQILLELAENKEIVRIEQKELTEPPWTMPNLVRLTEAFRQVLEDWKGEHKNLIEQPFYLPMIVPPNPWGPKLDDGGYLSNKSAKAIHLVKHRNSSRIRQALETADLAPTLAAVNVLQETPWRVNKRIYQTMCEVRDRIKRKELEKAKWTKRIFRKLKVCADYADEEVIYFPYFLDFRGRAYCLPPEVNPQADDMGRALLEFAEGKPLGSTGAVWLAIHVANCFGKDKIRYGERIDWVHNHESMIIECATAPLTAMPWNDIKRPWCFLRACLEWQAYRSSGDEFESHLPILMDGTCNGLQHLSAIRLDEYGAKATNLLPSDAPQDIYAEVARILTQKLEEDRRNGNQLAGEWLDLPITRDVCKMAVMTTPYGVTDDGIAKQLRKEDFTEKLEKHGHNPFTTKCIKHFPQLIAKLICHRDAVSSDLWSRMSPKLHEVLQAPAAKSQDRKEILVNELNRICQGPLMFDQERFEKVKMTPETKSLLEKSQEQDRFRLNRLLLEDVYPRHLKKRSRRWECCEYLSGELINCIAQIVDQGNEVKDWLQDIARLLAEKNIVIRWKAPQGFPIVQEKWQYKRKPVKAGKYRMYIRKWILGTNGKPILDPDAQANGIIANFIHSLDAAHMMLTINRLHDEEPERFRHFATIHDGYAVHACDVNRLHQVLRDEFVRIYDVPTFGRTILEKFLSEQEGIAERMKISFRRAPKQADPGFDIKLVRNSTYFFC